MHMAFCRLGKLVLAVIAGSVSGCAIDSPMVESLVSTPGYFDNFDCPEIVARFHSASRQVAKLTAVMDRAGTDPVGPLANAIAYNTDYAKAHAMQKHAEQAAQLKGCDLSKKPASADSERSNSETAEQAARRSNEEVGSSIWKSK
jgi:hypothetical protein